MPTYVNSPTIYLIQNMVNGKAYVGLTQKPIAMRWRQHLYDSKRWNYPLYKAFRKYGIENFHVSVLSQGNMTFEELKRREMAYIKLFGTMNAELGYNLCEGGQGCSGYVAPLEVRKRWSDCQKGKVLSTETKQKIRMAKLGRKLTPEHIEKITAPRRGMKFPPEWRAKMSASQRHRGSGITFFKPTGKWQVRISTDAGRKFVGYFAIESDAIAAREAALAKEKNLASIR